MGQNPEVRYTPSGAAVCNFSVATNESWNDKAGQKQERTEWHRIVVWGKLAELCSQFLTKGRKVFLEGRLSTRSWNSQDGTQRQATEIIISDMILLDSPGRRTEEEAPEEPKTAATASNAAAAETQKKTETQKKPEETRTTQKTSEKKEKVEGVEEKPADSEDEVAPEDIPF